MNLLCARGVYGLEEILYGIRISPIKLYNLILKPQASIITFYIHSQLAHKANQVFPVTSPQKGLEMEQILQKFGKWLEQ